MKFTATLFTLATTAALTSAAAVDPTSYRSDPTTLESRAVKWKEPQSWQGTCTGDGQCKEDGDLFPVVGPCRNSSCIKGEKCTLARAETRPEAKCPINHLSYDWEWPWIDHAAKTQAYQKDCLKKAKVDSCFKDAGKDADGTKKAECEAKKAVCDKIVM